MAEPATSLPLSDDSWSPDDWDDVDWIEYWYEFDSPFDELED